MLVTLRRLSLVAAGAATLGIAWPAAAALDCAAINGLVRTYLHNHIVHSRLSGEIERRAIDNFVRRLDPSRTLLTEPEALALRTSLTGVFSRLGSGDCSALSEAYEKVVERQGETERFVQEFVGRDDYAIDPDVTLVLDPDERGHPETAAERDELNRKLVHFQLSNYMVAGTDLAEAKEKLLRRYALRTKRMAEIDTEDLYSSFLDGFAASLDPHSNYLSAEVLEDFRISMSLSLEGIGVALAERDGYAVVERVIPGGAADRKAILEPKDKIIAVAQAEGDFVDIIDMPLRDAVSLIRGKKGTTVRLSILRQGEKTERFPVTIVRDTIDLEEQAAKLRFEERKLDGEPIKLAILELPSFYGDADPTRRQSTQDVLRLLREVEEAKADGLLLDLSRNGGGLLEHAVTISGYFIRRGEIVRIQNSRAGSQTLLDRDSTIAYSGPMVVHTSRVSASAAEIVAGALKDHRRAVITGDDHTFGKGSVQTVTSLPPGQGALKITTAMFFRPGGKSTQNDGVEADVVIPSLLANGEIGEAYQLYPLAPQRIEPFLSGGANGGSPPERYEPVTDALVSRLAERSRRRVEASEEFGKVREKLAEERERHGKVQLAEILEEQRKAEAESENGDAPSDEEPISPQLAEAINVLTDLVELTSAGG